MKWLVNEMKYNTHMTVDCPVALEKQAIVGLFLSSLL